MELCISCEEFRPSAEVLDCGHTFCDNCQQEKNTLDNSRCPICQEVSKPIPESHVSPKMLAEILAFRPQVPINTPTKEEIKHRYLELEVLVENKTFPLFRGDSEAEDSEAEDSEAEDSEAEDSEAEDSEAEERSDSSKEVPRLPSKTKEELLEILNDWYRSALKLYNLNEETITIYSEKVKCIQNLINTRIDLASKIWVLIQNLQHIQLIPNPLPRAFWFGRLSFTSDRDYENLVVKRQIPKSEYDTNQDISSDGHFVIRRRGFHDQPDYLIFKDRKIEMTCYYASITQDKIFIASQPNFVKVVNHDLVHVKNMETLDRHFSMYGYGDDLYTFTSGAHTPEIRRINSELEVVWSKPLNESYQNDNIQIIVGRSRFYLFGDHRISAIDKDSMETIADHRCVYSGEDTSFAYDPLNDVICGLDANTDRLRIFDVDLNMIGETRLGEGYQLFIGSNGDIYLEDDKLISVY